MNDCPEEKNLWNEFSYMIMGISLFEITSKLITHLEAKGDYGSPLYIILLTLTTIGLMIAVNYVLSIYTYVTKQMSNKCETNFKLVTKHKVFREQKWQVEELS